ncbi:MAG: nucleotidyltransferase family protein [Fibrobacterota bacterium]
MKALTEIRQILTSQKVYLAQRYKVARMAVFGSYSRGEQTPQSDVDILVEFNGPIGLEFVDLAFELEDKLGEKVDLVSKGGVKPAYLKAIESELVYV